MNRPGIDCRKKRNAPDLIVKIAALIVVTAAVLLFFAKTPASLSYFTDRVTSQTYNVDM